MVWATYTMMQLQAAGAIFVLPVTFRQQVSKNSIIGSVILVWKVLILTLKRFHTLFWPELKVLIVDYILYISNEYSFWIGSHLSSSQYFQLQ